MELTVFLKMFIDCSAFLTVAGFILGLFTPVSLLAPAALLAALCAGVGYLLREKGTLTRLAPCLAMLPAFALCRGTGDYALTGLIFCYLLYILKKGIFMNDDDDFKSSFQRSFALCLGVCLISALSMKLDVLNSVLLPYISIMAVCGIALMRILRHSRETIESPAFKLSNMAAVGLVCLLTLFFTSDIFVGALTGGIGFVYNNIIYKALMACVYAMTSFLSLFSRLFALIFHREVKFYENSAGEASGRSDLSFENEGPTHVPEVLVWIAAILLAAAVIFIIVKAFKALAGKNRRFDKKSPFETSRNSIEIAREPRGGILSRGDHRGQVRKSYRRFLKECLRRGMRITKDEDSAQIAHYAGQYFDGAPLDGLRDIYIKARYTEREITGEDAREAKRLTAEIERAKTGTGGDL